MIPALFPTRQPRPAHYRIRRIAIEAGSVVLGATILIWSLIPVYNMFLIAVDPTGHNLPGRFGRRRQRSALSSHSGRERLRTSAIFGPSSATASISACL